MTAITHSEVRGHHILPLRTYFTVAGILLVCTGITVWVAQYDFGALNMTVALLVAAIKASLVGLYFMHLLYDNKIYALVLVSSVIFLAIFITFTMYDVVRRDGVYMDKQSPIVEEAVIYRSAPALVSPETPETTATSAASTSSQSESQSDSQDESSAN